MMAPPKYKMPVRTVPKKPALGITPPVNQLAGATATGAREINASDFLQSPIRTPGKSPVKISPTKASNNNNLDISEKGALHNT